MTAITALHRLLSPLDTDAFAMPTFLSPAPGMSHV